MRRGAVAAVVVLLSGCVPSAGPRHARAARESVESLWDFAPNDSSEGVVVHPGAFARGLALAADLRRFETPHPKKKDEKPDEDAPPPLKTDADWRKAGLDPDKGGAAFLWPDRDRGALLVMPVGDHALFLAAFKGKTVNDGRRDIDEMVSGYKCVTVIERVVCARKLADVDAAAAPHSSPVAYGGEHLYADDTGDVEIYASPKAPPIIGMQKEAKDYGKIKGVASSIRIRDDGASLRVHVIGDMLSPLARAFAGSTLSKERPLATGAPTALHVHFDPAGATEADDDIDAEDRRELIDQLTGDVEVTTSGKGLIGFHSAFDLKDATRVEAYVKKKCKEAGSFKVGTGLRGITVTEHGCSAFFDTKLALLPIALEPIPIVAEVSGRKLEVKVGDGKAPDASERTLAPVVPESDAAFALADQEALLAFTKSPWIGPDVGAGATFSKLFWFVGDESAARIDRFNDYAAHVSQAYVAAKVNDDGVVMTGGFITFAHDPPEVRTAYDAALAARAAGDVTSYHARLADIEQRFPTSLAAQRAAELKKPEPYVGAGAVSLGMVGVWLRALDSAFALSKWRK